MSVQWQARSRSDRDEGGHRTADINLNRRAEVRRTHPERRRLTTLTWTPGAGSNADQAGRQYANSHRGRDLGTGSGHGSGTGAGDSRRARRE